MGARQEIGVSFLTLSLESLASAVATWAPLLRPAGASTADPDSSSTAADQVASALSPSRRRQAALLVNRHEDDSAKKPRLSQASTDHGVEYTVQASSVSAIKGHFL